VELFFVVFDSRLFAEEQIVLVMKIFEYSPLIYSLGACRERCVEVYGFLELSIGLISKWKECFVCAVACIVFLRSDVDLWKMFVIL
jgi:hypothetical protein